MTIQGVSIGDVFANGKHLRAQVVDFNEVRSMLTGEVVGYQCIAQGLGLAKNRFVSTFAGAARNRIANVEVPGQSQ
jgi:hypothetical protein